MIDLQTGAYLVRQGDAPTGAYLIESGTVEVLTSTDDGERLLAVLGAGEIIGEMALVDRAPRTASVRAREACVLMPIAAESLEKRLAGADPVLRLVLDTILGRYRALLGVDDAYAMLPRRAGALREQACAELRLEEEFAAAVLAGQIHVYYQPIVSLTDHRLTGFEALARWIHPVRGLIPPSIFVPIAEASGSSTALTHACLSRVIDDLPKLRKRAVGRGGHVDDLHISINISGHDLMVPGFIRAMAARALAAGTAPSSLTLELTETVLVHNPSEAAAALQEARTLGFRVAVDDFGTGYSTLNYIRTLPIDMLKIDRSFVQGMADCATTRSIVASTLMLAASLEISVVGEGIELSDQHALLQMLGCDYGQGYLFGRPMPLAQALQLVETWNAVVATGPICAPCA